MTIDKTYVVEDCKRGDDGVDKVDTSEDTGLVGGGQEGHQGTANNAVSSVSDFVPSSRHMGSQLTLE